MTIKETKHNSLSSLLKALKEELKINDIKQIAISVEEDENGKTQYNFARPSKN